MVTLEHGITGGQSLAIGTSGTPGYSTAAEASNAFQPDSAGALTALQIASTSNAQRPDLSMGYREAQAHPSQRFAFSTHGLGAQALSQLAKGGSSGKYEDTISVATATKNTEVAAGGTYHVREYHFYQGEQDQVIGTSVTAYVSQFNAYIAQLRADILPIDGVANFPVFIAQTATWAHYGSAARIGLAQLQLARTAANTYAIAQYQLTYAVDGLHLRQPSYYKLGELHARAAESVLNGTGWAPFAPTNITIVGSTVEITFAVPTGSLEFDTTTMAAQTNMGFSVSGTAATITGVAITAANKVTLTMSQPVTEPGSKVGYGVAYGTGPGLGNLCDGETAVSVRDGSRLANWALHFDDDMGIPQPSASGNYVSFAAYRFDSKGGIHKLTLQH